MLKLHEKKVLSEDGTELAVQLSMDEYRALEEYIEELEDSIALAEAIKNAESGLSDYLSNLEDYENRLANGEIRW
ncbi:hypothetical protein DRQ36_02215 [bacterium]|nr:MAG: hypothetical protein DRQ36_02215 [bacterium]